MDIAGATLLVTGSNGGLGRRFVLDALDRGAARVYAGARGDVEWPDGRVVPVRLDVTDPAQVAEVAARASDVDILVNNAGVTGARSLLTSEVADIRATFETNVFAPLLLTRAFAPVLAARGGGAVVNVLSVMSWLTTPGAYAPSKAAFWGLTNALRAELAAQSTHVLGAHFAYVDTPMTRGLDVPKSDAAVIVARVLDALEAGETEVLADDVTRGVHAALPAMTTGAQAGRR